MSRSDGRPSTDAEYQNLKSGSTITTLKLTAREVDASGVTAGEVVADVAAFNTLSVENLTVTNSNTLNEIVSNSHVILPLALGVLAGTAAYNSATAPRVALTSSGDEVSWRVYVPNSGVQRQIRVSTLAAAGAGNDIEAVVNGTTLAFNTTAITGTTQSYDTPAFDWTVAGPMTVVVRFLAGSGATLSDNVLVW